MPEASSSTVLLPPPASISITFGAPVLVARVEDLPRRRRQPRRQHQRAAVGQRHRVRAVVVHDRELLAPRLLRPAGGDVGDAAVEVAALAGQPRIDRVRHLVRPSAARLRRALELQPLAERRLGEDVPEPEAHLHPVAADAPTAPVISAWALIAFQSANCTGASKLRDPADMRRRRHLAEQPGAGQVVDHHLGDPRRRGRPPPPLSGTKAGAAKGIGSITPSVISMRSGACAAAANGRSASAAGTPISRLRRRRSTMTPFPRG